MSKRSTILAAVLCVPIVVISCLQPPPARLAPIDERPGRLATEKPVLRSADLLGKYATQTDADRESEVCLVCHTASDAPTMHANAAWYWSCVDCHGGTGRPADILVEVKPGIGRERRPYSDEYLALMAASHVQPRFPGAWADPATEKYSSANPVRSYALLNYEDPDFIQFVNPGDLRIAHRTCGPCHPKQVHNVRKSMMTHGAQLWGAAQYNNGGYPAKLPRFGESYSINGVPQRLRTVPAPTEEERARGVLDYLDPLPRWEISQMSNILRAFERGGKVQRLELEVGLPNIFEEGGKPDMKLSDRGLGTQLATDPVYLGIQKTRLLDPILSFLGTNDHPGDYRSSGCTACHVVYANDRSRVHSGRYAEAGNLGRTQSVDPTISRTESGHPIKHVLTRAIPSSQCIVCHVHPGTSYANTYLGFMWWDNETHGEQMYPRRQQRPTAEQFHNSLMGNPEAGAVRGLWSDLWPNEESHAGEPAGDDFLDNLTRLNPGLDKAQFADFHGHGWVFKAVFKKDRQGQLLDSAGDRVVGDPEHPEVLAGKLKAAVAFQSDRRGETAPPGLPVHLKDIHLERGMHCVDCHFTQDVHGDGKLYGEVRNAIEIGCVDCHGTINHRATLEKTSGPAGGNSLYGSQTSFGTSRFYWKGEQLIQRSAMIEDKEWQLPQIFDSVNPTSPEYNPRAARAKLMQKGGRMLAGGFLEERPATPGCAKNDTLAHGSDNMTCYACHTSWMTSCFGCHLSMRANFRMPMLHNEGEILRNYTTYNFQVLRDDVFMLGRDSTVMKQKIAPVRSSSAVLVGSANANREWTYSQQQTISTEGFSGQAFNPHYPHAVRKTETRQCTDCHLSEQKNNNAWMAQVLLHGTNFVNFLGRYVYVATGRRGFEAVVVTEREEPQAVIGSYLHEMAYPDKFKKHARRGSRLREAHEHGMNDGLFPTGGAILDLQLRGEYVYAARGEAGFYVYDVANIDNKGFSERIVTAPVSPLGQNLYVPTRYATAVASPTTLGVDPLRRRLSDDPSKPPAIMLDEPKSNHVNQEQKIHAVYGFLYVTDLYEGLIVVAGDEAKNAGLGVGTLLDGDRMNNFLKRAVTFNPDGALDGAVNLTLAGNYAYVCCKRGLVVVDLSNPLEPRIAAEVLSPDVMEPSAVAVQFRYAFVCDREGLKVIDVTIPSKARAVSGAAVPIEGANRLYVARTYAYVAAGKEGLVIVDVGRPESPEVYMKFTAGGRIDDARDVKVGMTNASAFAYVADGHNGLRVIQLMSPRDNPDFAGFSPKPTPRLIATYQTHGPALGVSKGLDRDRAVDESGNQVAVFGRIGSRPLNGEEQRRLYLRDGDREVFRVRDDAPVQIADEPSSD